MAADDVMKLTQAAFAYQCALVGNGQLSEEGFKTSQKTAIALYNEIVNNVEPWARSSIEDRKQDEITALVEDYRRLVGDPNDPEFRAKLDADLARVEQLRKQRPKETPEARLDRLAVARDEATRRLLRR